MRRQSPALRRLGWVLRRHGVGLLRNDMRSEGIATASIAARGHSSGLQCDAKAKPRVAERRHRQQSAAKAQQRAAQPRQGAEPQGYGDAMVAKLRDGMDMSSKAKAEQGLAERRLSAATIGKARAKQRHSWTMICEGKAEMCKAKAKRRDAGQRQSEAKHRTDPRRQSEAQRGQGRAELGTETWAGLRTHTGFSRRQSRTGSNGCKDAGQPAN